MRAKVKQALTLPSRDKRLSLLKKRVSSSNDNCAGLIFRQSAQSLLISKNNAIGEFIRRLKGRKGAPVAIKAGARKLAIAFYNAITRGVDYVEKGAEKYKEQLIQKERKTLIFLAKKHNLHLIECQAIP